MSKFLKHNCKIKELDKKNTGLPPLKPNANCFQKGARFMRKLLILNMANAQTRDFFRNTSTMRNEMRRHTMGPYHYIIHPFSVLDLILEAVFVFVMVIRLCLLASHVRKFEIKTNMDFVADIIWLILMASFFFRGYADYNTRIIHIKPKRIILHYLRTYFLFDLSIFACPWMIFLSESATFTVISIFVMFISFLVRFKSFMSVLEHLLEFMNLKKSYFIIYHMTIMIGILHLLTCFVLTTSAMILLIDGFKGRQISDMTMYDWYVGAFSIVIFHFLGAFFVPTDGEHTDDHPITNLYSFIILLIGRMCTLILIAKVLAFFGFTNMSSSMYEQKMNQLLSFVRFKELPPHLKQRVILYFRGKFNGGYFDERGLIASMSESIRAELFLFGARKLISHQEAFKSLPPHVLGPLIAQMDYRIYLTGDVVIDTGSSMDKVYFVSSGTLAGYNAEEEEILHLEEGGQFGLTSWLVYKSNITVLKWVAVEMSELYIISRDALGKFFDAQTEVAKYFEAKMKERATKFQYRPGGKWKKSAHTLMEDLRGGILLRAPRLKIFAYES